MPKTELSKEEKLWIYTHLSHAELFEGYLARKEKTAKRFGLEGGETCLPVLVCRWVVVVATGRVSSVRLLFVVTSRCGICCVTGC